MDGHSLDFIHTTLANEDTYDDLQNPHHTPVINVTTLRQMQHTETENQSTENGASRCFNNTTTTKNKLPHHAFSLHIGAMRNDQINWQTAIPFWNPHCRQWT